MNETVNKFLLFGYKFMLEMHFKKSGFTCTAGGPSTRKRKGLTIS